MDGCIQDQGASVKHRKKRNKTKKLSTISENSIQNNSDEIKKIRRKRKKKNKSIADKVEIVSVPDQELQNVNSLITESNIVGDNMKDLQTTEIAFGSTIHVNKSMNKQKNNQQSTMVNNRTLTTKSPSKKYQSNKETLATTTVTTTVPVVTVVPSTTMKPQVKSATVTSASASSIQQTTKSHVKSPIKVTTKLSEKVPTSPSSLTEAKKLSPKNMNKSLPTEVKQSNDLNEVKKNVINEKPTNATLVNKPNSSMTNNLIITKNIIDNLDQKPLDDINNISNNSKTNKTREEILKERELKKQAKQSSKKKNTSMDKSNQQLVTISSNISMDNQIVVTDNNHNISVETTITDLTSNLSVLSVEPLKQSAAQQSLSQKNDDNPKKPILSKAERRAIQETQRAAKAKLIENKQNNVIKSIESTKTISNDTQQRKQPKQQKQIVRIDSGNHKQGSSLSNTNKRYRVKLFDHLYDKKKPYDHLVNSSPDIHPAIKKLGIQYASGVITGSNARCLAFMKTMKEVITDYKTPPKEVFCRVLDSNLQPYVTFLDNCRPMSVSIHTAFKFIKYQLTQLSADETEETSREKIIDAIDTYIRDQIEKAYESISDTVIAKISNGDVILTFGCSSLIKHVLEKAKTREVDFRVIIVDSRPLYEGREMLRRLTGLKIRCTYVLINAVGFIMPEVTKVLLGAHSILANGYVMSRIGTAQVALTAKYFNVPVLVCCEAHKFSERSQTDAFVYNEICEPTDLVLQSGTKCNPLANWHKIPKLSLLHLNYDVTPSELITGVVTDLTLLPCSSVPVVLRMKP